MIQRQWNCAVVVLAALWVCGTAGAKLTTGFYDLKPLVLVVYDTSGSMSYVQKELTTPVCTTGDTKDSTLVYTKSRDIIAKEVLTGTFSDYWCRQQVRPEGRFDYGYPIPWFTAEFSSQAIDGIIDSHKERIKFGFMTFDTNLRASKEKDGEWSIGFNSAAHPTVGLINLGIKNENATSGKLVIPSSADDFVSIKNNNVSVQDEILKSIPMGGTPISPSLRDVFWLFKNHRFLVKKTLTNTGDPYAKCRARNVLLITDGRPTMGEGEFNYPTSVKSAEKLFKFGHKVYVVGFNLGAGVASIVNDIAKAGGTEQAHIAKSAAQLSTALSAILGKAAPGVHSRTTTVATNITNSNVDLQYQLNTAYSAALKSDIDIRGYGEVTAYRCTKGCKDPDSGGAGACNVTEVRDVLNTNNDRKLFFVQDGVLYPLEKKEPKVTPDFFGIPTTGVVADVKAAEIGGIMTSKGQVDLGDATARAIYMDDLVDFLHGKKGSRRQDERLGGIWHSTPVIQSNLANVDIASTSFKIYQASIASRPTIAYMASHDGFIHAIHMSQPGDSSPSGTKWLQEIWGVVPQTIVKNIYKLVSKTGFHLDGQCVLKDIRLSTTAAALTPLEAAKLWRSILVCPFRQGGRGMIAMDVTDPFNPFVRWEVSNKRLCYRTAEGTTECKKNTEGEAYDYRNLGYTHGRPKIGTLFLKNKNNQKNEEIAAIFYPCGDGISSEPQSGKCFMVTRLDNGQKIKEFKNASTPQSVFDKNLADDNVTDTLDFNIVGNPAAYNTFYGTFVTRLFVGDKGGQLWRIDVSSNNPDKWRMDFFFDIYYDASKETMTSKIRSPLRSEPALSPVPQRGTLVLVFGSGDLDYATDLTQRTYVYSIKEQLSIDPATGALKTGTVGVSVNWKKLLKERENLTSRPIVFGKVTYYTSFEPDANDACNGGIGRIWGIDYLNTTSSGETIGKFDKDGDPATAGDLVEFIELKDSIPYGLSLINRPACVGETGVSDAVTNGGLSGLPPGSKKKSALTSAKPGQLELVIQTGSVGKTNAASTPAKGTKTPSVRKVHQRLVKPAKQVLAIGWGQVQQL